MDEIWSVYLVECRTKDIYVGISKDVDERIKQHNAGQACRYTKFRGPVRFLYAEPCDNYLQARRREKEIKRFSRKKKLALIKKDLSP